MMPLARSAAGTLALNVSFTALNFGLVLALSRLLGADGYGAYASAFAWSAVLSVVAVLGLAPLVVRHVAAYQAGREWGLMRGLLRRTVQSVVIASTATVAGGALVGLVVYRNDSALLHPFLVGLLLVPLVALTTIRQSAMQGLGRVVLGRIPETLLMPALAIALVLIVGIPAGDDFSATQALALVLAAAVTAFVAGTVLLRRSLPQGVTAGAPEYDMASWRRSGLALVGLNVAMAASAQVGTIVLGLLATPADAGIFNVAQRTTVFISFVMLGVGYPLMPLVARLYAEGQLERLRHVVLRTARLVTLVTVPIGVTVIAFGPQILSLFGTGFSEGGTSIRILAVAEVVNIVTGFGGLVLVMCGRERDLALSVAAGTVLNVVLSAALVPVAGVEGAAIGTAAGLVFANAAMSLLAWTQLAIWTPIVRLGATAPRPA